MLKRKGPLEAYRSSKGMGHCYLQKELNGRLVIYIYIYLYNCVYCSKKTMMCSDLIVACIGKRNPEGETGQINNLMCSDLRVPGNESGWGPNFAACMDALRRWDPHERPVQYEGGQRFRLKAMAHRTTRLVGNWSKGSTEVFLLFYLDVDTRLTQQVGHYPGYSCGDFVQGILRLLFPFFRVHLLSHVMGSNFTATEDNPTVTQCCSLGMDNNPPATSFARCIGPHP